MKKIFLLLHYPHPWACGSWSVYLGIDISPDWELGDSFIEYTDEIFTEWP